jgi:hypothetical protein
MLPYEDMAEVGATFRALDLYAMTVLVRQTLYRSLDFFVEAWPAAAGVELRFGTIQWCVTTTADVHPFLPMVFVLARIRRFRALVDNDTGFLGT